uniref:Putative secreted protein n=1 Tax=Rhipicephalus microplus TaxID=6941 RepID=A0A6M2DBD8_RHIMP
MNFCFRFGALPVAVLLLHVELVCSLRRLRVLGVCFIGRSGAGSRSASQGRSIFREKRRIQLGSCQCPMHARSVEYRVIIVMQCPSGPCSLHVCSCWQKWHETGVMLDTLIGGCMLVPPGICSGRSTSVPLVDLFRLCSTGITVKEMFRM